MRQLLEGPQRMRRGPCTKKRDVRKARPFDESLSAKCYFAASEASMNTRPVVAMGLKPAILSAQ